MATPEDWMRDRIILIERELGGAAERARSLEQSDTLLRREITEIGTRITEEMNRQHAHLRGEISRLGDIISAERGEMRARFEASTKNLEISLHDAMKGSQATVMQQRQRELTEQNEVFKEEIEKSKRTNQHLVFAFGIIIVIGEKIFDYAPQLISMISPTP